MSTAAEVANPQMPEAVASETCCSASERKKMGMVVEMSMVKAEFATSYKTQLFSALESFDIRRLLFCIKQIKIFRTLKYRIFPPLSRKTAYQNG